uniref:Uncharacterized protein n=1 Tax=Acrobeloides nanus TaxID=290746 RepID=A0A914D5Z6_9BILA
MFLRTTLADCNCNKQQPLQPEPWTFNSLPHLPIPNNGNNNGFNNLNNNNNNNFGGLNNLNNGGGISGIGDLHSLGGFNGNNNNNNNGQIQLPHGLILGTRCCQNGCNCANNHNGCNCGNNNNEVNKFNLGNQNGGVWTETVKFGKGTRGSSFPQTGSEIPITEFGINGGLTSSNGFPPSGETFQVLSGNGNWNSGTDNFNSFGNNNHGLPLPLNQGGDWNTNFGNNGHNFGNNNNFGGQNGNSNGFPYVAEKWQGKK